MVEHCVRSAVAAVSLAASLFASAGQPGLRPLTPPGGISAPSQPNAAFRRMVTLTVVGKKAISQLTRRKPVLGGRWFVGSSREVRFLGSRVVAIDYEDGHIAGRLIARVGDPSDVRTWQVIRDEER